MMDSKEKELEFEKDKVEEKPVLKNKPQSKSKKKYTVIAIKPNFVVIESVDNKDVKPISFKGICKYKIGDIVEV